MYSVVVNEGPVMADDNAIYFTPEMPTFSAVEIPVEGSDTPSRVVFIVFTPNNGRSKGEVMQVPFSRVVSISDGSS